MDWRKALKVSALPVGETVQSWTWEMLHQVFGGSTIVQKEAPAPPPAAGEEDLDALRQEMVDRFGRYPEQVENLFRYAGLRQEALALQIQSIERNKGQIFFRFVDQSKVDAEKLLGLVTRNRNATFSPQGVLALDIEDGAADAVFRSIMGVLEEIRQ